MEFAAATDWSFIRVGTAPWADVVVDGVDRSGSPCAQIPESLNAETDARGSGATLAGQMTCGNGFVLEGHPVISLGAKPIVVTVVTFPDGLRLGIASGYYGDYQSGHDDVWDKYLQHSVEGLGSLFAGTYHRGLAEQVLADSMSCLRDAVADPARWLDGAQPVRSAAPGLVVEACAGFPSRTLADAALGALLTTPTAIRDARIAGWRPNTAVPAGAPREGTGWDLAWVLAAERGEWIYGHVNDWDDTITPFAVGGRGWAVGGWLRLRQLRDQGWSLSAMRLLHTDTVVHQTRPSVSASGMGFEQAPTWAEASGADRWVEVTGSPQSASLHLEAGLSLEEATRLKGDGKMLDEETLRVMAGLAGS